MPLTVGLSKDEMLLEWAGTKHKGLRGINGEEALPETPCGVVVWVCSCDAKPVGLNPPWKEEEFLSEHQ